MDFKPRYGDPNWVKPPYELPGNMQHHLDPQDNGSYEENRLRAQMRFVVPEIQSTSIVSESNPTHETLDTTSTLSTRHATYLRWAQRDRVRLLVGTNKVLFRLPIDLLTQRSPFFRVTFDNVCTEADTKTIRLPDTSPSVFENIVTWMSSTEPKLNSKLTASTVLEIAIFATKYMVPAILHQALDLLRARISSSDFRVFTPQIAKKIYDGVDAGSLLHQLAQAAIPYLSFGWAGGAFPDKSIEEGMRAMRECLALASDYFFVTASGWKPSGLVTGGPCRFHRHESERKHAVFATNLENLKICPNLDEKCFESILPCSSEKRTKFEGSFFQRDTRDKNDKEVSSGNGRS